MTEANVSCAGNLTDDPQVRYTESGIAERPSEWPVQPVARRQENLTTFPSIAQRLQGL
jgi:hypothetical protein